MAKQSAGLVVFRQEKGRVEVLLVHPGGPFFAKKDNGVWSIPKGEFTDDEDRLVAARREFTEELGSAAPEGDYIALDSVKQKGGKTVYAWAVEATMDTATVRSNTFTMEWPPRSGTQQEYPEVDRAAWFDTTTASQKLTPAQAAFLERLTEKLGLEPPQTLEQVTLF